MITKYIGDRYVGLSSDTKPANLKDGGQFEEIDTGKRYTFISGGWIWNTQREIQDILPDGVNITGGNYDYGYNTSGFDTFDVSGALGFIYETGKHQLEVVVDGVRLVPNLDYEETSTSIITFKYLLPSYSDIYVKAIYPSATAGAPDQTITYEVTGDSTFLMVTGAQDVSGVKTFKVPAFFESGLYISGKAATTGGPYYPLSANPNGYLTSSTVGGVNYLSVTGKNISGTVGISGKGSIYVTTGNNNTILISGSNSTLVDDGTFVRTSGDQIISGNKSFKNNVYISGIAELSGISVRASDGTTHPLTMIKTGSLYIFQID
jgi:hypothetical protein